MVENNTGGHCKAPYVALYLGSQVGLYKAHHSIIWVRQPPAIRLINRKSGGFL